MKDKLVCKHDPEFAARLAREERLFEERGGSYPWSQPDNQIFEHQSLSDTCPDTQVVLVSQQDCLSNRDTIQDSSQIASGVEVHDSDNT